MSTHSPSAKGSKVKVVHITTVHHPFDTRIFYRECQTLANAGYDVALIAPWHESTTVDLVRIHALPPFLGRTNRFTQGMINAYRAARSERGDVYHVHDPELLGVAVLLAAAGHKVIYDAHEDLPNQLTGKYWIPNWCKPALRQLVRVVEKGGCHFMTKIIAATPTIAAKFPSNRTTTIHNYPIVDELILENNTPYGQRPANMIYVGAVGRTRGAHEMVLATQQIVERYPNIALDIIGDCRPSSLQQEIEALDGAKRVTLWGRLGRVEVRQALDNARIGLVVLHPTQSYLDSYPIKLFEYMAAGIPVIASDFPLWREIVERAQCGLLVDPHSPAEIARAAEWILTHPIEAESMGRRGQQAAKTQYTWQSEGKRLLELYQDISQTCQN